MKRYPEYKDSGIPWMAEVPEHWKTAKLKHVVRFFGGGTPDKSNLDYWTGTIPWVSPKDMKSDHIDDAEDHISEDAVAGSSTKMVDTGAVLMVVRSGILKHTIPVAINRVPVALNQDMKALVPDDELVPNYLRYLIKGEQDNLLLEWRKQGATVESVEQDYVADTVIPLPPVVEQQFISDYLDRKTQEIDDLIQKKQRLIDLLKEQRTAVINRAVTKGLDPNVPMKDSGVEWLGEVPAHWVVTRLRYRAESVSTGSTPPTKQEEYFENGDVDWYTPGDFGSHLYLSASNRKITRFAVEDGRAPSYAPGTVLLVGIGATLGKVAIVDRPCSANQQVNAIRFRSDYNPVFGAYYLRSISGAIVSYSNSATLPILNQTLTKEIPLLAPPKSEQDQIVSYIEETTGDMDTTIGRELKAIDLLRELRMSLISEVVTGKIDVREGVEEAVPTEP